MIIASTPDHLHDLPAFHMPSTLFLTGSVASKAMKQRLSGEKGEVIVLEYDTLLDRALYPNVGRWTSVTDLLSEADFKEFKDQILRALEFFLMNRPETEDLPGDSDLRRAAMPGAYRDTAFFRRVNQTIFERARQKFNFDRLVVTAGGGVHFDSWREMALQHSLPIEIVPPEWCKALAM